MWAVRKEAFAGAKQDGGRLLKQIQKQLVFSSRCRTNNLCPAISTPEIYGIQVPSAGDSQASFVVDMEYIPFNDARHIMLEKDKATNEWMINTAIDLIDSNLSLSTTVPLADVLPKFFKKASSIKSAITESTLISQKDCQTLTRQIDHVLEYYSAIPNEHIPVGPCHGDLNLANMLVETDSRELCVFDFLDCFVVSNANRSLYFRFVLTCGCRNHLFKILPNCFRMPDISGSSRKHQYHLANTAVP
jgi:hypothetical protein